MSGRGRGRGRGGGVKPNDTSSSSSSAASSRNSSQTRPTSSPSTTTTVQDADRLMKQITTKLGVSATSSTGLGATSRAAPKFVPNLTASKKDKDKTDSNMNTSPSVSNYNTSPFDRKDHMNGNKSQLFRGGGPNYRGGHGRGNFVQMEGIFHGTAQIPVSSTPSSFGSRTSSKNRDDSPSNIKLPNIKKLGPTKTTVIGDVDGLKYEIDEEYEPRQIPIAERKSVFDVKKEPNVLSKIKESTSTNTEHIDSFLQLFSQQKLNSAIKSDIKDEPIEPTDLPIIQPPMIDPSQLILMQFPDVLPCTRTSSSSSKPELASLSDLPDGFLGKLQIYKSGKCRLKLNDDTYLDVDIGQPTSFLQNVMVTEMASTNGSNEHGINNDMNKLVCLGDIKHKLIVSLDVDHVLEDTRQ
jgi:hypothetical protein